MTYSDTERAALGELVTRSQLDGSPAQGVPALIDEEIQALRDLLAEDLSSEVRDQLKVYFSWGNWYPGYWGPYAAFFVDNVAWKIGVSVGVHTVYLVCPSDEGSHYAKPLGPGVARDVTTGLLGEIAAWRQRRAVRS